MLSISSIGMQGIQTGLSMAERSANSIATAINNKADSLPQALVNLQQSKIQVEASAKIESVGSKMMGSIIDLFV